jgi:predicted phage terminase large subunit-like protein
MLASYEADFASTWGRKVRDTTDNYGEEFFGLKVSRRTSASDMWDLAPPNKGGMYTAGVGGALTGKGANLLIVDDPVKNAADAASETLREKQWNWYKSTFRTRLEPDGVILLIGTRWNEDDLIGRVVQEMNEADPNDPEVDKFVVVRLPAIAEIPDEDYPDPDPLGRNPGEPLFPERFPLEKLQPYKSNQYTWSALYQQRPAPAEGGLFEKEWFEVVPSPRIRMRKLVRRWDLASTDPRKGEDPDYSVGLHIGLGEDGFLYIMDMVRVRESPGKLNQTLKRTAIHDGYRTRIRVEQEPGSSGKIAVWHLAKGVFSGYNFRGVRSTGDKMLRAETVSAAAERGEIKVVKGRWNRDFFKELTRFPNDAHDDIVDALSGGYEDLVKRASRMVTA